MFLAYVACSGDNLVQFCQFLCSLKAFTMPKPFSCKSQAVIYSDILRRHLHAYSYFPASWIRTAFCSELPLEQNKRFFSCAQMRFKRWVGRNSICLALGIMIGHMPWWQSLSRRAFTHLHVLYRFWIQSCASISPEHIRFKLKFRYPLTVGPDRICCMHISWGSIEAMILLMMVNQFCEGLPN